MEANSDGDEAEQIFYDTVREYVVSVKQFITFSVQNCLRKIEDELIGTQIWRQKDHLLTVYRMKINVMCQNLSTIPFVCRRVKKTSMHMFFFPFHRN